MIKTKMWLFLFNFCQPFYLFLKINLKCFLFFIFKKKPWIKKNQVHFLFFCHDKIISLFNIGRHFEDVWIVCLYKASHVYNLCVISEYHNKFIPGENVKCELGNYPYKIFPFFVIAFFSETRFSFTFCFLN